MPDYFNLLSKSISSPSIVYHAGTDKAWQEFEKRSGIQFPTDYKKLINKYGTGGLNNFVWFLTPFVTDENAQEVMVGERKGDYYEAEAKDENSVIVWYSEDRTTIFSISAALSKEEMVKVAESVEEK